MTTPDRTTEQRMEALAKGNAIRCANAQLKREIKTHQLSPADALSDPRADYCKVEELLMAIPGFGRVKVYKLLARLQIAHSKKMSGLSPRQREALHGALGGQG